MFQMDWFTNTITLTGQQSDAKRIAGWTLERELDAPDEVELFNG
jgi:hypothetical protein